MTTHTDVEKFLQAVFLEHGTLALFANLNPPAHTRDFKQLDASRDCYWAVAAFDPGHAERTLTRALDVRALVIDDVGTKVPVMAVEMALGTPTAIVETSRGNFQWVYRLSRPVAVVDWNGFFAGVEKLIGYPLEGCDAVHLFRLPMGANTKPSRGMFKVRLAELNPGIELSVDKIKPIGPAPTDSGGADVKLSRVQLEKLMEMLPNDLDRDGWIEVGHGLKALCVNDDEGFEVFDAWSQLHDSYDAGKTRTAWDSFGASGLRTKGGMLRARAEGLNPERFKKWEAAAVFDDGEVPPGPTKPPKAAGITATPYQWIDPDKLPLRDWLYGRILIRKFISMTVAPGGVGKSSLVAVETLAQVTGQALLGEKPPRPLRVWLWNLEDPLEETKRKIQAAALRYGISEADIGGRLFVDSGRDQRLVVAEMNGSKPAIMWPVVKALVEQIKLLGIDVVVVDPFVSCHEVPENDNTAQDMVVKEWGRVAELGNCAVHLIDHTSKAGSQEVVTDSSRGAKAKTDAARIVRVINRMTKDEGEKVFGIGEPWRYFHTFNDKANMAPPVNSRDWFHLESAWLGNGGGAAAAFGVGAGAVTGDSVGVVTRWMPPSAADLMKGDSFKAMVDAMGDKQWLEDPRAGEKWIGNAAAQALNLDPKTARDRKTIKDVLERWFKSGVLKEVEQRDERRKLKQFIKITGGF